MLVTQKCQYALRAVFELARRRGGGPIKIAQIAEAQQIPIRFLEVILSQLKQGGFVASRRGTEGGYQLALEPAQLTVGAIVKFVDGGPFEGASNASSGHDLFDGVWLQAARAVEDVFENVSLQDLMEQDALHRNQFAFNYEI